MGIPVVDRVFNEILKDKLKRLHKIEYDEVFGNSIHESISIIGKSYNVYTLFDILNYDDKLKCGDTKANGLKYSIGIKIFKTVLGLIPNLGILFSGGFCISDIISDLKYNEIHWLCKKVNLKAKKKNKYKRIKNIIFVPDCGNLADDEYKKLLSIMRLIEEKYITNTIIIIGCKNPPHSFLEYNLSAHTIQLNRGIIYETFNKRCDKNQLEFIKLLGFEAIELVFSIKTEANDSVKAFFYKICEKNNYKNPESLLNMLKCASSLFEKFILTDLEFVYPKDDLHDRFYESLESHIIEEQEFFYNFSFGTLRQYFKKLAKNLSSEERKIIIEYLIKKYPDNFDELAITHIDLGIEERSYEYCIKAIYFNSTNINQDKRKQIHQYLSNDKIYRDIVKLDCWYKTMKYDEPIENVCLRAFEKLSFIDSPYTKLMCMGFIARVAYEKASIDLQNNVAKSYIDLIAENALTNRGKLKQSYISFIIDFICFSTCIENDKKILNISQRLIPLIEETDVDIKSKYRIYRLGNALYYNSPEEAKYFTEKAYKISETYGEKLLSSINYSCSLGIFGDYCKSQDILEKYCTTNTLYRKDILLISAMNNYLISKLLAGNITASEFVNRMKDLIDKFNLLEENQSDIIIILNNLLAGYVIVNDRDNFAQLYNKIIEKQSDYYHLTFAMQNKAVFDFINRDFIDKDKYKIKTSYLLSRYENLFDHKLNFLEKNIGNLTLIKDINEKFNEYCDQNNIIAETHYRNILMFGYIERWFE